MKKPVRLLFDAAPTAITFAADSGATMSGELSDEQRAQLIEALNAGRHVEAEVEILAYRQSFEPGAPMNTHGVRVRSGAMAALARTGRDIPFMREHGRELDDRGGTVLSTKLDRIDGEERLVMRVRLTAPWAVLAYLQRNLDRVSIGLQAGKRSDVHCTVCKANWLDCNHRPLEQLEDGRIVEYEYQSARLLECSAVAFASVAGTAVCGVSAVSFSEEFMADIDSERGEAALSRLSAELKTAQIALRERDHTVTELTAERDRLATELKAATAELSELKAAGKRRDAEALLAQHTDVVKPGGEMAQHLTELYVTRGEAFVKSLLASLAPSGLFTQQLPPEKAAAAKAPGSSWKPNLVKDAAGKVDVNALLSTAPEHVRERLQELKIDGNNAEATLRSLARHGSLGRLAAKSGLTVEAF